MTKARRFVDTRGWARDGGEERKIVTCNLFFSSFSFPPFLSPCGYSRACRSIRARGVLSMTLNTIIFCPLNRRHLHIYKVPL